MNFLTAAIVAGVAFLLSFLSGLVGGVPLFDILLRACFWAAVGFGGCLGVETLLRSLVPDLFSSLETSDPGEEPSVGQAVNITMDEEVPVRGGFVEEVDQDVPVVARPRPDGSPRTEFPGVTGDGSEAGPVVAPAPAVASAEGEEEMPEIGSFLDAFKPEAPTAEGESPAPAAPEYGEYSPVEPSSRASGSEVTIDGEVQDPAILAKAVQTVMKRDAQGN